VPKLAPCVMVLGSASQVGKSVIATALCRVLREEGYAVAPFKAQNMSLNAAATRDGGEIGRAQAAQAEAAGIEPRVSMNPVLLKPEADTRSQVVVLGKATGTYAAREYWRGRNGLWPVIRSSLRSLRREFDVVVIEGAGSPAELNLERHDLANMRVAAEADAAAILVGDIERGGIFAQLLGTLDLLPASERKRVRALVANKFRGDRALFDDGVRILRRRSGLPVFVLPFAEDLGVPSEDALAALPVAADPSAPEIAVVVYPHVSNHDDLEPLAAAGARIRYVRRAADLDGPPDLIVLPGSKTTIADLAWMRTCGIAQRVIALARSGTPVLGLCGGFQMLGRELRDPDAVEGHAGRADGLGLLPVRTTFTRQKRTLPVEGRVHAAGFIEGAQGCAFVAYEIHLGVTRRDGAAPFADLERGGTHRPIRDGAVSADGLVIGTYAHGLFQSAELREALLRSLAARRGSAFAPRALPSDTYARVSEWLRGSIDVRRLLAACGIEGR
jgi:adenosylcobyric acid synthase